jgi:hypothetical protein
MTKASITPGLLQTSARVVGSAYRFWILHYPGTEVSEIKSASGRPAGARYVAISPNYQGLAKPASLHGHTLSDAGNNVSTKWSLTDLLQRL